MVFKFREQTDRELKIIIRNLISSETGLIAYTNKDFSEISFDTDDVSIKNRIIDISKDWLYC